MRQLCKGNVAVVKAAIMAGCRAYYGYPITPASEIAEYAALLIPQVGGTFVQAESEVSAINMVYGAAAAGQRVLTASSGPGISLMQEGISYIAGAELPCVIAEVMRGGPGLGNIAPEMRIEVQRAFWVPLDEAPARLSYKGEREMAERALEYVSAHPELGNHAPNAPH